MAHMVIMAASDVLYIYRTTAQYFINSYFSTFSAGTVQSTLSMYFVNKKSRTFLRGEYFLYLNRDTVGTFSSFSFSR